jgi:Periplasmic copper-binding protein (NosD)
MKGANTSHMRGQDRRNHDTKGNEAMPSVNSYDVTTWPVGNAAEDIGEVINSIIAEIKTRQTATDEHHGGKPGAVIYVPPGDYHLRTQVVIDVSFLRIEGSGHGFTSSSIRFNVPEDEWPDLHELWPGGSRIVVDLPIAGEVEESKGAAFSIERSGSPRISSVEFANFCIDGMRFDGDGSELHPANTYVNGKTGIYVGSANDSFRITGMGFVFLEHALTIYNADALSVHDNFIAECGSCIELRGWGQASKITDNLIGAGFKGHSIYAENHGGLLITANNVFPRGGSSVHLNGVTRSSITNNRLHSFYPGMVVLAANSSENLVATNHFLRDQEPWTPFLGVGNGLDDVFGLLRVDGSNNSVIGNHFSEVVDAETIRPTGATPVIIRLVAGGGNYISSNHVVAMDVQTTSSDSCFSAQVDALLTTEASDSLAVTAVQVDSDSTRNTILDSGTDAQVVVDRAANAFRATPAIAAE